MKMDRIILIISFFTGQICFGQTCSGIKYSSEQHCTLSDTIPNWEINKTLISIDTIYILNKLIEIDGKTFNYKKSYSLKNGYYEWGNVKVSSIIEYGNVNSEKLPDGYWIYKLRDDWTPVSGTIARGHKLGEWSYNCAYICKIKYKWNWNWSKTIISKKKIIYD